MKGILWAVLLQDPPVSRLYSEGSPHHITLQYDVEKADWERYIGRLITVQCTALCSNERIQALKVKLPWLSVPCANRNPHITVSWIEGASPVESNQMLVNPTVIERVNFSLTTEIEFYEFKDKES